MNIKKEEFFPITSVCREDLENIGFNATKADDSTMRKLAGKMADDYCDQLYWDSLEIIADILGIPRKKGK